MTVMDFDKISETNNPRPLRLLRLKEVKHRTALSTATIYRRMKDGTFPVSHSLGGSRVAWSEAAIDAWIMAALER
jgi:prophage regulatory protein